MEVSARFGAPVLSRGGCAVRNDARVTAGRAGFTGLRSARAPGRPSTRRSWMSGVASSPVEVMGVDSLGGETGTTAGRVPQAETARVIEGVPMRMPQRVLAAALMAIAAIAAFAALGAPAVAAPMPWDSHRIPAAAVVTGDSGTVAMLCGGSCYE